MLKGLLSFIPNFNNIIVIKESLIFKLALLQINLQSHSPTCCLFDALTLVSIKLIFSAVFTNVLLSKLYSHSQEYVYIKITKFDKIKNFFWTFGIKIVNIGFPQLVQLINPAILHAN